MALVSSTWSFLFTAAVTEACTQLGLERCCDFPSPFSSGVALLPSKLGRSLRQKLERPALLQNSALTAHRMEDHFPGTLCNAPFELAQEVSPAQSPTEPHISALNRPRPRTQRLVAARYPPHLLPLRAGSTGDPGTDSPWSPRAVPRLSSLTADVGLAFLLRFWWGKKKFYPCHK